MHKIDTDKLKKKYLIVLGLIFFIAFILRVYSDVKHHEFMIVDKTSKLHKQTLLHYENIIKNLENNYISISAQFINMNEVSEFIKKRDRDKLYNYLLRDYKQLVKYNPNLYVMHFLDTKNTTILRMHKPRDYDDNLSSLRPIIARTNKDKKIHFGYETGKNGITYRVTTPFINRSNEHLGVLEFGIKPKYFVDRLENLLNIEAQVLIKTSQLKNLTYKTEFQKIDEFSIVTKNSLFKNFKDKIDLNKQEQIIQSRNKTYILFNNLQLRSYKGEVLGKVLVAKDITKEVVKNRDSLLMLNISTFFALFICFILIYFIFNHYSKKLVNAYESINELEIAVDTDALTGINSRKSLDNFLQNKVNKKNEYAVIFFDIDHFKKVNDTYGHDVGDIILKELTAVVSNTIRSDDFFARWGGEEFVIVLKTRNIKNAVEITKKIRTNINSYTFHNNLKITCSFGVTMLDTPNNTNLVIKRADKLLYAAKDAGRDCIKSQA